MRWATKGLVHDVYLQPLLPRMELQQRDEMLRSNAPTTGWLRIGPSAASFGRDLWPPWEAGVRVFGQAWYRGGGRTRREQIRLCRRSVAGAQHRFV
jgi:hypothetical protein